MGFSQDYSHVPDWVEKPEGYQTGAMVKYEGNVFIANFWASKPGEGDPNENGWRLHDELYDVTSSPADAPTRIIGYIPTWRKKEGFDYANAQMYRNITHGIISFLMFSETNLGEFESKSVDDVNAIITDVVLTGQECGTYISIALGGAVDYGFLYLMERIGNNPGDPVLQKAVKNVVDFVEKYGLDGVDLDLECWWNKNNDANKDRGGRLKSDGPHPAGKGLTEFAKQLKQAMPDKIISAALFATSWYGNCYDPGLVKYVDWLGIMTYDLTGSWNQSPVGPQTALLKIREQEAYAEEQQGEWPGNRKSSANATDPMSDNPILSVEDSLWYWTNPFFTNWQGKGQNLPRNKIAAGVPIYGYDFAYGKEPDDLSGQVAPGYKTIRYKDLLSQFPDADTAANGNIKVPGNTPRPPFVSASGTYPYAHNIYFETPKTATDKLNFLKSVGAQGVIIWELSNDVWEGGKSVIQALYQNSGNPASRPALPSKPKPEPEPEPKLELNLPFPQELLGVFPDEWSENKVISPGLQDIAAGALESFQVSRALNTTSAGGTDEQSSIRLSGSPAVAVYNGKLYCVREGAGEDGSLRVCTYDGQSWSEDTHLSFGISGPPALAVYNGKLYCVREGAGEDGWLWVCTYDGQSWSEDTQLSFGTGSRRHNMPRAALSVYQERLYCVHQGGEGREDSSLWFCSFDGQNWSKDTQLPNHSTSSGPALAVVGDLLVCMHEASGESGTLMETRFDGNTWSEDKELLVAGNGYGTSGPPAMVVHNGRLYCVHEGLGEDGWIWSFNQTDKTDQQLTSGLFEKQPIGTSGPPALAVFNDDFILLHEGREQDGFLWGSILSASAFPSNPSDWTLLEGDNSYCYCACSVADNTNRRHSSKHTMNVKEGAPYFYAVLTKDDDSVDFPTGAILTIEGPDGTNYDRDIQEENQLVILSGSSVRCLIVKDPKPGDWKMTMTVPEGVGFHCECNTVPSKDVYDTITETLDNSLQKRGLGVDKSAGLWFGLTALGAILFPEVEVAVIAVRALWMAASVDLVSYVVPGKSGDTQTVELSRDEQIKVGKGVGDSVKEAYKKGGIGKAAQWVKNTASGKSKKKKKKVRRYVYAVAHNGRGDFIIGFKNKFGWFFHNNGGEVKTPPGQFLNGGDDYALPGGELEEFESPIIGAWREFFEETNEHLSGWRAQPDVYEGREPPDSLEPPKYYGVYFDLGVDRLLPLFETIAEINLESGRSAAEAVSRGEFQGDYAGLRRAFPGCPPDNELETVHMWNLRTDWQTIQGWQNDRNKSWYYYILNNLRNQVGTGDTGTGGTGGTGTTGTGDTGTGGTGGTGTSPTTSPSPSPTTSP